jgi:hypothetical protein
MKMPPGLFYKLLKKEAGIFPEKDNQPQAIEDTCL